MLDLDDVTMTMWAAAARSTAAGTLTLRTKI
jgi:hypothetical protein